MVSITGHQVRIKWPSPRPVLPKEMPSKKLLVKAAEKILVRYCQIDGLDRHFELSIVISDDREITYLNRIYRQQDRPTDVLSFPQIQFTQVPENMDKERDKGRDNIAEGPLPPPGMAILLGDVVISYETSIRQAQERDEPLQREFLRLLIHGILHLFGYDHVTGAADRKRMELRERQLMTCLRNDLFGN